nr:MAG TPA: hypothetical protein [Caudoviricetes sp.]
MESLQVRAIYILDIVHFSYRNTISSFIIEVSLK